MERKFCQSCGMPLTDEVKGTNADGTLSEDYCMYCYKDGEFTQDMTMEEMIEHCAQFTDEINRQSGQNLTKEEAKEQMRRYFPNLKRWKDENKDRLLKSAEELLARCEDVTIASINSEGFPRPVPMAIMKTAGCSEIWMSTGADSLKTIEFKANPKAGVCYSNNGDSVAMRGYVDVVTDDALRKEMWKDWMIHHFPQGPTDPNYVLLRFKGFDATIWIANEFAHLSL